jgi:uncharacterized protein (TIGR03084 family)
MTDPAEVASVIDDLQSEHHAIEVVVRGALEGAHLEAPTLATSWSVRDTIEHLAIGDRLALLAVGDPEAFAADRAGHARSWSAMVRGFGNEDLCRHWHVGHRSLIAALRESEPARRVVWVGPSMSLRSFATARIMENWAHGEDIAHACRVAYPVTDRLRHICHLGVLTRGFSFTVRGQPAPDGAVRVELKLEGGGTWLAGDPAAEDRVSGPARDFCLVVTQRRHVEDTALAVRGDGAAAWMRCAQAFAGAPTLVSESRRGVPC